MALYVPVVPSRAIPRSRARSLASALSRVTREARTSPTKRRMRVFMTELLWTGVSHERGRDVDSNEPRNAAARGRSEHAELELRRFGHLLGGPDGLPDHVDLHGTNPRNLSHFPLDFRRERSRRGAGRRG